MTRIREKVKDIVDIRPFEALQRFDEDPERTIESYHFCDATAAMMARWLKALSETRGTGCCFALAGHRGVGKSHFISTIASVAANPEFRSKLTDAHVLSCSQSLQRRHYPHIAIWRGTGETLEFEFEAALERMLGIAKREGDTVFDLLNRARSASADLIPVITIDTSLERQGPVNRNDGETIALIGEAAKELGIFVMAALDDDIAAADGSNVAISRTFAIEYLDQEHLYSVVASRLFPKNARMASVLEDLYQQFRDSVPGFRWSEHRFRSLYPLHPVVPEVAPYIRYYCPEFALLGFASIAGECILGRPAASLIGLEEVFDAVEPPLRRIDELKDSFEAFDRLDDYFQRAVPATERHKSRLLAKALLIFSLSGRAATSEELAASTLLFDEADANALLQFVETTLAAASSGDPLALSVETASANEPIKFRLGAVDEFNRELEAAASDVPDDVVNKVVAAAVRRRFPDLSVDLDDQNGAVSSMECIISWRGSIRRGTIALGDSVGGEAGEEWRVCLRFDQSEASGSVVGDPDRFVWQFGQPSADDIRTIRKYHVLGTDEQLRIRFADQVSSAFNAYGNALYTAVDRMIFTDARLGIEGFDYNFSEAARSATTLAEVFSIMLEPLFETRYPDHPYFAEPLTDEVVERYIAQVFGSKRGAEADNLARSVGVPLGIAALKDDELIELTVGELLKNPYCGTITDLLTESTSGVVHLEDLTSALSRPPMGLGTQAQRLLLCALVTAGAAELLTTDGARVGGRSLDLKIDWDDISQLSLPRARIYSAEKIARWASIVSGDPSVRVLRDEKERSRVMDGLKKLEERWRRYRPVETIDSIADVELSTKAWRNSQRVLERVAPAMTTVAEAIRGDVDIEVCMEQFAERFSDSPEAFEMSMAALTAVEHYGAASELRSKFQQYLATCERTNDAEVEALRSALEEAIDRCLQACSDEQNREMRYAFERFHKAYVAHYKMLHERVANADRKMAVDNLITGPEFAVLERLSTFPAFSADWTEVRRLVRTAGLRCRYDVGSALEGQPVCHCGLSVSEAGEIESALVRIESILKNASNRFIVAVTELGDDAGLATEKIELLVSSGDVSLLNDEETESLVNRFESSDQFKFVPSGYQINQRSQSVQ